MSFLKILTVLGLHSVIGQVLDHIGFLVPQMIYTIYSSKIDSWNNDSLLPTLIYKIDYFQIDRRSWINIIG